MQNYKDHKELTVKFRFPIVQTEEKAVVVQVPLGKGAALVSLNKEEIRDLGLTDAEHDAALHAAFEAALRSIMIVK